MNLCRGVEAIEGAALVPRVRSCGQVIVADWSAMRESCVASGGNGRDFGAVQVLLDAAEGDGALEHLDQRFGESVKRELQLVEHLDNVSG